MHPRPVIRWKSFWFGILVLGFLGWAWVRASGHCDTMRVFFRDSYWHFESWGEHVDIERNSSLVTFGWLPSFDIDSDEGGRIEQRWFPPAIERFNRGLRLRRDFEESWKGAPDPFGDPDPEQAAAEHKKLIAEQIEISDYMTWRFAWWFLVVMFLVPWLGFLAWRWRKQRNLTKTNA